MKRLSKAWRWQGLLVAGSIVAASTMPGAVTQKFYPDDPLRRDPEDQDAAHVTPNDITHSYGAWQMIRGGWDHVWRRAMNVNSMDEVSDSSWFTNRLGFRTLSIADIARGPDRPCGPAWR